MAERTSRLTHARSRFAQRAAFLMGLSLLALGLAASAGAAEAELGTMRVEVHDSVTGEPVAGACIEIFQDYEVTPPPAFEFSGVTGTEGAVSIDVEPGFYQITVSDCDLRRYSDIVWEFSGIEAGETTVVEVLFYPEVEVSGTVTDGTTGTPLYRMCVEFSGANEGNDHFELDTVTDEAGTYTVSMVADDYFVKISDCGDGGYVDLWLDSPPWVVDPVPLVLSGGSAFVIDAALTPAGFITGMVTNELTGISAAGICVSSAGGEEEGVDSFPEGSVTTGVDGTYRVAGLPAGEYVVHFRDCRGGDLITEYHSNADNFESATPVTVVSNATTIVDAALAPGARLSGSLSDEETGHALAGTCVWLMDSEAPPAGRVQWVQTDGTGAYSFERIRPGNYRILFSPVWCAREHAAEWYNDTSDPAAAAVLELLPGESITGIDAALSVGSTISGSITLEAGGDSGILIEIHHEGWTGPFTDYTFGSEYTTHALPPGEYQLRFASGWQHLSKWYDDASSQEDAAFVTILPGGPNVTGIDASLSESGQVRGTVIGLTGYPHIVQCVYVYDLAGELVRYGNTGEGGAFHIGGFETGQYRINTAPCSHNPSDDFLTVWFGGSLSEEAARIVNITAGQTTWGINIVPTRFSEFDPAATVALVDDPGRWHTIDGDGTGATFYFGLGTDQPVLGDWNCDGTQTPGMFRPSNGFFYLTNTRATSFATEEFYFGQGGDIPLAGDWNNDGCDTVGVYRPSEGRVYLRNTLDTGVADIEYYFGQTGDIPFAGDFNADGTDEIALHRPTSGRVYLRYTHTSGEADLDFYYGIPGDRIFTGDWNGDGTDTLAVYRPGSADVFLSFTNATGPADVEFRFGDGSLRPAT